MKNSSWSYLRNPFNAVTRGSFKLMNKVATDHFDKLNAALATDARLADLHANFKSQFMSYQQIYTDAIVNSGVYKSKTQIVEGLFAVLTGEKIRRWDILTQVEYDEKSPAYQAIFPQGREPYQTGGYESRIIALKALAGRMALARPLQAVAADVLAYADDLQAARQTQQSFEHSAKNISADLEAARQEMAKALQASFFFLGYLYINNLVKVESFFDLELIRSRDNNNNDEKEPLDPLQTVLDEAEDMNEPLE